MSCCHDVVLGVSEGVPLLQGQSNTLRKHHRRPWQSCGLIGQYIRGQPGLGCSQGVEISSEHGMCFVQGFILIFGTGLHSNFDG